MLKVVIQSSGKRPRHLSLLMESLRPALSAISVIEDVSGTSWGGAELALKVATADKKATHVLVLQEDIIVCKDFVSAAEKISTIYPQMLISFFNPRKSYDTTRGNQKRAFVVAKDFVFAQAYMLPVEMARELLEFKSNEKKDDYRINEYLESKNVEHLLTNPSLVEHMDYQNSTTPEEKGTFFRMKKEGRQALDFIGIENSALEVDWE